ncbi:dolichyl-phosphate-mannose-protein mannosyltransferase [bacterium BMS3Abin15]|nr:dolichyl-phosphate-mannose-protein mannosyltransferase [bacterium BMS3Abin15]
MFITAFGIRLYHINQPPLDFAPVRQYQLAHSARNYYFEGMESIPEWRKRIARINMERIGVVLEPRIMENAAVLGYRITGGEHLWIPRALSSVFWIVGGIFLYLTAKRISSPGAALFSTAFYLFLPFGISASRSFQPDPMMIMMLLCSIFTILKHNDQPSKFRLLIAGVISALAILVKPYCIFLIFFVFLSLSFLRYGVRKALISSNLLIFTILILLPTVMYYVYGILNNVGYLQEQAQASFLPSLLLQPYFWKDWLTLIGRVVGYIPFTGALIGFFLIRDKLARAVLSGLWIGYFVFGLFFTYHIHTHAYYQLQFIPVVALSLYPLSMPVKMALSNLFSSRNRILGIGTILVVLILGIGLNIQQVHLMRYKDQIKILSAVIGVNPAFRKFLAGDFEKEVKNAEEIGEIVGHSTNTVFLAADFGRSLAYNGELSGLPWPIAASLRERKERGLIIPSKEELFNSRYLMIRTHGKYIKYAPDFFIITDFKEFENQTDLKDFLNGNFPIIAQNEDYLIFDLRKMSGPDRQSS